MWRAGAAHTLALAADGTVHTFGLTSLGNWDILKKANTCRCPCSSPDLEDNMEAAMHAYRATSAQNLHG